MIKPTVGRVVHVHWFHNGKPVSDQPLPAFISYVWSDRMVNLGGFDANGKPFAFTSVELLQDDDPAPRMFSGAYATWMPYQNGQAAKTVALEEALAAIGETSIEQEIQAQGLTAPRVTPMDIEANIEAEYFFTAADGVHGAEPERRLPASSATHLLTLCILVLRNGFTVTGESACASPENFDAALGRKIARQNAVQKMWPLMGYELKQRLADGGKTG